MPIYEYYCQDCRAEFEALRSIKDADALIRCKKCNGEHTSRKISVFFAQSGGQVIAGGNGGCSTCSSGSCSTCGG
jgi:putative FmdB family regulatory protein